MRVSEIADIVHVAGLSARARRNGDKDHELSQSAAPQKRPARHSIDNSGASQRLGSMQVVPALNSFL